MNPIRTLAVALFGFGGAWLASAGDPGPLPDSWLHTSNRTYTLEFHHANLVPACRREAAQITQVIINDLLARGCTVLLSRGFVTNEFEYYRRAGTNEAIGDVGPRVQAVLVDALAAGEINWGRLQQIQADVSDLDAVARGFPWLYSWRGQPAPRMAPADAPLPPLLEYHFDWQGAPMRGIAAVNLRTYIGAGTLWKADTRMAFHASAGDVREHHYPAEPWAKEYVGHRATPHFVLTGQILDDLRRGLTPPPSPAASNEKRNKRKR